MPSVINNEAKSDILRKVLYDEPADRILREARAAGVGRLEGERLYAEARQYRIKLIRSRGLRQILGGLVGLVLGMFVYTLYAKHFGWTTFSMRTFYRGPMLIGAFFVLRGLNRFFLPHWKGGSIACDP